VSSSVEKTVRVNKLFDVYGGILTPRQQEILSLYYQYDLSLGEISERLEVTRQAVYDTLIRGIESMESLESEIGLLMKIERVRLTIQDCLPLISRSHKALCSLPSANGVNVHEEYTDDQLEQIAEDLIKCDKQLESACDILRHLGG